MNYKYLNEGYFDVINKKSSAPISVEDTKTKIANKKKSLVIDDFRRNIINNEGKIIFWAAGREGEVLHFPSNLRGKNICDNFMSLILYWIFDDIDQRKYFHKTMDLNFVDFWLEDSMFFSDNPNGSNSLFCINAETFYKLKTVRFTQPQIFKFDRLKSSTYLTDVKSTIVNDEIHINLSYAISITSYVLSFINEVITQIQTSKHGKYVMLGSSKDFDYISNYLVSSLSHASHNNSIVQILWDIFIEPDICIEPALNDKLYQSIDVLKNDLDLIAKELSHQDIYENAGYQIPVKFYASFYFDDETTDYINSMNCFDNTGNDHTILPYHKILYTTEP